jgi:hypothetical protein
MPVILADLTPDAMKNFFSRCCGDFSGKRKVK